jgi:hypothetical protein
MRNKVRVCLITSVVFIALGCGKSSVLNPLGSCNQNIQKYTSNILKLSSTPSKANCEAVVNSLDKIIKDCREVDAATRREYEQERDDIDCNDFNNM